MTNSWTDIRNTDLVIIMGGNAAEAHPCGFKWVTEAKANRGAKLIVVDPRFTRSAVGRGLSTRRSGRARDIAFLLGVINYCIQNDKVQWEYVKAFTNAPYLVKEGFGYTGRPVHRLRRGEARLRPVDLGLRARPRRLRRRRRHAAASALRLESAQEARRGLHAGDGRAHLRHAEGQVPEGRRDDRGDVVADQDDDVDVCARLDPAFQGLAEHPRAWRCCSSSSAISACVAAA